jgi:hypothetical protein
MTFLHGFWVRIADSSSKELEQIPNRPSMNQVDLQPGVSMGKMYRGDKHNFILSSEVEYDP